MSIQQILVKCTEEGGAEVVAEEEDGGYYTIATFTADVPPPIGGIVVPGAVKQANLVALETAKLNPGVRIWAEPTE